MERTLIKGGWVVSMDDAIGDIRGGDVLIDSAPGSGTTVKLYFPACRPGVVPEPPAPEQALKMKWVFNTVKLPHILVFVPTNTPAVLLFTKNQEYLNMDQQGCESYCIWLRVRW